MTIKELINVLTDYAMDAQVGFSRHCKLSGHKITVTANIIQDSYESRNERGECSVIFEVGYDTDGKEEILRIPKYHIGQKFSINYPWQFKQEGKCKFHIYGKFEITNTLVCNGEVYYVMTNGDCVINVREDILEDCYRC